MPALASRSGTKTMKAEKSVYHRGVPKNKQGKDIKIRWKQPH